MRRALLADWPDLSRLYDLKPWHTDLLSVDELNAYLANLAAWRAAQT